jgi:prepilin-type N-terminal cleavage/methylation domain-containing protein
MLLRSRARAGFTLLEILLASLIAALLLAALYFAMNMTLQQAQTARDAVESDDLTRGVFAKMTGDLNGTLAPLPPKSGGNAAASGGTVTGGTAGTDPNAAAAPADPAAGATGAAPAPDPNAATAEPATPGATDNSTAVAADLAFQGGLIGDNTKFTLFVGRTPEVFGRYGNPGEQVRADLRQVIYWFEEGRGLYRRGLYRRERPWVTAEGVRNGVETDPDEPDSVLLAEEVTAVTFEYAEGTGFVGTWDGTTPGPDGVTPMGPPRAVKITLTYQVPVGRGKTVDRTVSQVIVIRAAPGTYTPPLLEAPTDGATEGGGTTGGSTTGGTTTGGSTTGGGMTGGMTGGGTTGGAPTSGGMTGGGNTGGTRPTGGTTGGGSTGTRPSGGGTTGGATGGGGTTGGGRTGGTTGGGTTGGGGR